MRRKHRVFLISSLLMVYVALFLSFATNIISTEGLIRTDGVDICIVSKAEEGEVMPGKKVKYEPIIKYRGVDAYIRMTLDISSESITEDMFGGLGDDWVKRENYFYCKKVVHSEDEIPTFKYFKVPANVNENNPNGFMASSFNITALCDAVQAANFTPDFESENPWGELEIEESSYDGTRFISEQPEDMKPIEIGFDGAGHYSLSSKTMIKRPVLPGDSYRNQICLRNKGDKDTEVFFFVSEQNTTEKNNLLDALLLTVKIDDRIYYTGSLRAAELVDKQSLVLMKPGAEHILSYEIHMPAELKNQYQEKIDNFVWNFTSIEHAKAPQTGDENNYLFYAAIAGVTLLVAVILRKYKKGW